MHIRKIILTVLFLIGILSVSSAQTATEPFLMHYWSFNNETTFTTPDISLDGASLTANLVGATELLTGTGQDFSGENARNDEPAGAHLRFNNPIGSSLTFKVPTTGFENIVFTYETRRSNNGANLQYITYTLDGTSFQQLDILDIAATPTVVVLDFSEIEGASDNADFAVRIEFNDSNNPPNTEGNNRFDNVTVDGTPLADTNLPPVVANPREYIEVYVGQNINLVQLGQSIFEDPEGDELIFYAETESGSPFDVAIATHESNQNISLVPNRAGEGLLTLSARDENSAFINTTIRVLVYPTPHTIKDTPFVFESWSQDSPAGTYPSNMIFLQSDMSDPGLDDNLLFAYNIPLGEYADADLVNFGFPYRNTARTRINGLGDRGVSFINTGRGRDLGGALVALNTTDVTRSTISFTAGTEIANSRVYAIRAQYRTVTYEGETEPAIFGSWTDITLPGGEPIEYERREDGHSTNFINHDLPQAALGQQHIQVLFRYYFTGVRLSEDSGARDMLRLDNIEIANKTGVSLDDPETLPSEFVLKQNYPNPFNPATTISFTLPNEEHVQLSVYNMLGQQIATLVNETRGAGTHQVMFDATGLSSGIYIYRIQAGSYTSSMRMTLIK